MRALRLAAAFLYGFTLFYFVWVWLGGFMAARQVSPAFFKFFGRELALAVLSLGLHLIPTVAVFALGTWFACALSRRYLPSVAYAVLAGAVFSYAFWLVVFAAQGATEATPFITGLLISFAAPWWAWPAVAAPLIAFGVAYLAAVKYVPPPAEA